MSEEKEDLRAKYLHGQPQDLSTSQKFRLILRLLRERFHPDHPVIVRRVNRDLMGADKPYGICWLVDGMYGKYYRININKQYSWGQQFETLLHEWAHALTWNLVENGKDHGDIFHRYYGNLYRAFVED